MALQSICSRRGCGRLYTKSKRRQHECDPHASETARRDNERRNAHRRRLVYEDARWRVTRPVVLARDGYTCVDCGLHDESGKQLVPDHDPRSVVEILDEALRVGLDLEAAIAEATHPDSCKTRCLRCSGTKDGARANTKEGASNGTAHR